MALLPTSLINVIHGDLASRCGRSATTIERTALSPKPGAKAGLKAGFLSLQLCSKGATLA
jgi:hypothetical protein